MRKTHFLLFLLTGFMLCLMPLKGQALNGEELEKKLQTLAIEKVKAKCNECQVTVDCKWIAPPLTEASASAITGLHFDDPGMPAGYTSATVAFNNRAPSPKNAVQLYVQVRQKVPVARKNINRGASVTSDDLAWKWKDISRFNRQPLTSINHFEDKTTTRMIRKGHVFYSADLIGDMSVQPGDKVAMQYDETGVRIQINCVAREAKDIGQKIRLYSKETGQRYIAKIISKDKIVWEKTL